MERSPGQDGIEAALGYVFRAPALLDQALTHKSALNERPAAGREHNERLEFLGDAVVSLVITDHLVARYPHLNEGSLSKLKARLVSERCLANGAKRVGLGRFLKLGRGEELTQGREKPSLLADALEAVTAAIYLDGGVEAGRAFVLRVLGEELAGLEREGDALDGTDFKTRLQEYCQRRFDVLPSYRTVAETGPDHQKRFEVELTVHGEVWGMGAGHTKKAAEQAAAREALRRLAGEPNAPL